MTIEISPRKIFVILLSVIGFLLFAHLIGLMSVHVFDHDTVYGLIPLFDLDSEMNIPTLYSSLQLIFVSLLLLIIGTFKKSNGEDYVTWLALAVIFLFLAVDETAGLHERLALPVREAYGLTGILHWAWVIPYGFAVLVLLIALSKFLLGLPEKTKWLFIASGAIFVTGAIGFEMLGASNYETYHTKNVVYSIFYTCEESLEMVGVALFIYALLAFVSKEYQYLRCTIKN